MNPIEKEYVSLKELHAFCGWSLNTLRAYASRRKLPGLRKVGRRIFVNLKAFKEWFEKNRVS